jgi:hypothetical protein
VEKPSTFLAIENLSDKYFLVRILPPTKTLALRIIRNACGSTSNPFRRPSQEILGGREEFQILPGL